MRMQNKGPTMDTGPVETSFFVKYTITPTGTHTHARYAHMHAR